MIKRNKGNVIINTEMQEVTPIEKKTYSFREVQPQWNSLAEKIAKDKLFYKNYYYAGGRQLFPNNPKLQTVDKYFPYAEGGPLFIDELSYLDNANEYAIKTKKMKELGHRYVAIEPKMNELDILERL